jgi:hypothetical protein
LALSNWLRIRTLPAVRRPDEAKPKG